MMPESWEIVRIILSILSGTLVIIGVLVKMMHNQGMRKLDSVIDSMNKLVSAIAVHDEKFSNNKERLDDIEKDIHKMKSELHFVRNKMMTQEHVSLMIQAKSQ